MDRVIVFTGYALSGPVWRLIGGRTPAVGGTADAAGREHP